jgi:hypothetical protein
MILLEAIVEVAVCPMPHAATEFGNSGNAPRFAPLNVGIVAMTSADQQSPGVIVDRTRQRPLPRSALALFPKEVVRQGTLCLSKKSKECHGRHR